LIFRHKTTWCSSNSNKCFNNKRKNSLILLELQFMCKNSNKKNEGCYWMSLNMGSVRRSQRKRDSDKFEHEKYV
jgi:hypothetical protein